MVSAVCKVVRQEGGRVCAVCVCCEWVEVTTVSRRRKAKEDPDDQFPTLTTNWVKIISAQLIRYSLLLRSGLATRPSVFRNPSSRMESVR